MPSEGNAPSLLEEVASMYVDGDSDKITSQTASSGQFEQPSGKGATDSASPRKRKKGSRKGKERAVDVNEEDVMDTT